eukprot:gene13867-59081_t
MNHLDVGFSGGSPDPYTWAVVNAYFTKHFPKAIATSRELNATDGIAYVYTTHCWLVSLYLDCPEGMRLQCPNATARSAFEDAVRAGWITQRDVPGMTRAVLIAALRGVTVGVNTYSAAAE